MVFKASLLVFFATLLGNFFNYLYHLICGRFLTPNQYGLLESFIALSYFLAVVVSSFNLSIINQVNATSKPLLASLVSALTALAFKLTALIWLIFLLLYPLLKPLLHLDNPYLFLIFSLQILFAFFPMLYLSLLQARFKFRAYALVMTISPLTKTIASLVLLYLGWQLLGAISGLTLAGVAAVLAGYLLVKKTLNLPQSSPPLALPKNFWQFSRLSFITQLSLTSLISSDILLTRFYLPTDSGSYSALSVVGKIIFFAAAAVLTVSFPIFNKQKLNRIKLKKSFYQAFFLLSFITLIGWLGYQLFPSLILQLMYGFKYQNAAPFLPLFSLFISLYTLLNFFIQLLLALQKPAAAVIAGLTASLQIGLILSRHTNLLLIIQNSLLALSFGLCLSLFFAIKAIYAPKN
jgi:O-antigen/teichoic acid export membrane protein